MAVVTWRSCTCSSFVLVWLLTCRAVVDNVMTPPAMHETYLVHMRDVRATAWFTQVPGRQCFTLTCYPSFPSARLTNCEKAGLTTALLPGVVVDHGQ